MLIGISKMRNWTRRIWQRALARGLAHALRDDLSYRLCTELWRLPAREPRRDEAV